MRLPKINLRRVSINFPSSHAMLIVRDNPNQPSKAEKLNSQKNEENVHSCKCKQWSIVLLCILFWGGKVAEQTILSKNCFSKQELPLPPPPQLFSPRKSEIIWPSLGRRITPGSRRRPLIHGTSHVLT